MSRSVTKADLPRVAKRLHEIVAAEFPHFREYEIRVARDRYSSESRVSAKDVYGSGRTWSEGAQ